jgi:hypothetical protein
MRLHHVAVSRSISLARRRWVCHNEATKLSRQYISFSPIATAPSPIHAPPPLEPINWACRRLRKVVKDPIHQAVPPIAHQSSPIWDFPKSISSAAQSDLVVANIFQVHSCPLTPHFSILRCSWYSLTHPIELESIRSSRTSRSVHSSRCHRGQYD